jgi:NAD(P)-dependent dehydrogenase (short-subunit alcohol dehydrogenase family)
MGGLDVVVNNAGYANLASVEDFDLDDFKTQVETNFFGTIYVTKAVIPILRKRGGHIMQIARIGARLGTPGLAAYQSAKWAATGLTAVLSSELKPLGIHCTILQPGGMRADWSGSSITCAAVSATYEETVGNVAKILGQFNGNEPTDPVKVGEVCVRLSRHPDRRSSSSSAPMRCSSRARRVRRVRRPMNSGVKCPSRSAMTDGPAICIGSTIVVAQRRMHRLGGYISGLVEL